MAMLAECTPGRRVRVKTKGWFGRKTDYPYSGMTGTVKFTGPVNFVCGMIKVEFDNGQEELVGFDTLDLI